MHAINDHWKRGSGLTTAQMKGAPIGAAFVWCNNDTRIAKRIADRADRSDLKIFGPSHLTGQCLRGLRFPAIVLDHAAELSDEEHREFLLASRSMIRPGA